MVSLKDGTLVGKFVVPNQDMFFETAFPSMAILNDQLLIVLARYVFNSLSFPLKAKNSLAPAAR